MRLRRKQEEEEEEEEWRHPIYNLIGEIGPEPEAEVVVASTAAPTPPKLLFLPDRLESELLLLLLLMRMMLLLLLLVLSYLQIMKLKGKKMLSWCCFCSSSPCCSIYTPTFAACIPQGRCPFRPRRGPPPRPRPASPPPGTGAEEEAQDTQSVQGKIVPAAAPHRPLQAGQATEALLRRRRRRRRRGGGCFPASRPLRRRPSGVSYPFPQQLPPPLPGEVPPSLHL